MRKVFKTGSRGAEAAFSGAIEEIGPGRVRGWACDDARPDEPLALDVTLDGVLIATIFAAEPRANGDNERRGGGFAFDATLDLSQASGKILALHVRGRPDRAIGPVRLEGPPVDPWPGDALGRLAHLFAHVTAVHLESIRRDQHMIEHVSATHNRIMSEIKTSVREPELSQLRLSESGFSGIGHSGQGDATDATERAIFKKRIEMALATR